MGRSTPCVSSFDLVGDVIAQIVACLICNRKNLLVKALDVRLGRDEREVNQGASLLVGQVVQLPKNHLQFSNVGVVAVLRYVCLYCCPAVVVQFGVNMPWIPLLDVVTVLAGWDNVAPSVKTDRLAVHRYEMFRN